MRLNQEKISHILSRALIDQDTALCAWTIRHLRLHEVHFSQSNKGQAPLATGMGLPCPLPQSILASLCLDRVHYTINSFGPFKAAQPDSIKPIVGGRTIEAWTIEARMIEAAQLRPGQLRPGQLRPGN
jgi:hypothetical protein